MTSKWFPTFLKLWPFTVPHVIFVATHNYHFATGMNRNVGVSYAGYLICDPCEKVVQPPEGSQRTG